MNISIFGVLKDVFLKRKNALFRALPELPPPSPPNSGNLYNLYFLFNVEIQDLQMSFNRTKILYLL